MKSAESTKKRYNWVCFFFRCVHLFLTWLINWDWCECALIFLNAFSLSPNFHPGYLNAIALSMSITYGVFNANVCRWQVEKTMFEFHSNFKAPNMCVYSSPFHCEVDGKYKHCGCWICQKWFCCVFINSTQKFNDLFYHFDYQHTHTHSIHSCADDRKQTRWNTAHSTNEYKFEWAFYRVGFIKI